MRQQVARILPHLLLGLRLLSPFCPPASAQPVEMLMFPADTLVHEGTGYELVLVVNRAANLGAFQFTLAFDPALLHVTSLRLDDFLNSTGRQTLAAGPDINRGAVTFGAVSFGPAPGATGQGRLASALFKPSGNGTTAVRLVEVQLTDVFGNLMAATWQEGVRVRLNAAPKLDLPARLSLPEDQALTLVLDNHAHDADHPNAALHWAAFTTSGITAGLTQERLLTLAGAPDFHGGGEVVCTALDPLGAMGRDTIQVQILPVNDPPEAFQLIAPPDGAWLADNRPQLRWTAARERDPGDHVSYLAAICRDPDLQDTVFAAVAVGDTCLNVPAGKLAGFTSYYWTISATDDSQATTRPEVPVFRFDTGATAVRSPAGTTVSNTFELHSPYPNPARFAAEPETLHLAFALPVAAEVVIRIHNLLGQEVSQPVAGWFAAGAHQASWNGRDHLGRRVSPGIYFAVMAAGGFHKQRLFLVVPGGGD